MTKLLSKKDIKEFLMLEFCGDERITDELLFNGKELTLSGYALLNCALKLNKKRNGLRDVTEHHCYTTEFTDLEGLSPYRKEAHKKCFDYLTPKAKEIREALDKIVQDDECYFITDGIAGERDDNEYGNNYQFMYNENQLKMHIDIWLFSQAGTILEMADNNDMKIQLLFNTIK